MLQPSPTFSEYLLPPATAWSLRAWPRLLWQARATPRVHFQHIDTCIVEPGEPTASPAGQTVWATTLADCRAGMAWDWVQITQGVVAIADPMSLVTNLRLIGDEGEVLTAQQSARFLNELVRLLPWQQEVHRALRAWSN
jgi:hypothetical protein